MGKRISIIGGDLRQITVADYFAKDGYDVSVFGFDESHIPQTVRLAKTLAEALKGSTTVILGIAPCDEKMNISAPYCNSAITAHSLVTTLPELSVIIGGKLSPDFVNLCNQNNVRCYDYVNRDDFAVLNAVPTAEGALAIAMEQLPFTIHSCKCLVTGFGRIGKILARDLHLLGAEVTCTARKSADLAWISALGYKSLHTSSIISAVHHYDLIFNTVPQPIFTHEVLRNVRSDTLIIDLASKPGGVDFDAAGQLDIKVIWALSLPGKCAPVTAGKIIKNTVENILSEL